MERDDGQCACVLLASTPIGRHQRCARGLSRPHLCCPSDDEQVSISGQALVFVTRTQAHSFADRAGGLTYLAFAGAQVG